MATIRSAPSTSPGVATSAPRSNRSFWMSSKRAGRRLSPSAAIATPIAALASSTSPIAVMRRLDLLTAAAVDQPGGAAVAGTRVDLVELDQAECAQRPAPATTRIRMTMTIATAWNSTRLRIQFCCCSPVTSLPEAMAMTPRTRT